MLRVISLSAVLAMLGAFLSPWLFVLPRAAHLHLAFALGIMPLILAAMGHFVPVLTRSREAPLAVSMLPLLAWLAGLLACVQFVSYFLPYMAVLAAALAMLAGSVFFGWAWQRGRMALGQPHPCLNWYLAALLCLLLALAAIVTMEIWPEQRLALKRLHLHLNLLGFIGLTAFGTLQVLLPTVAGRPDSSAAPRLRQDLPLALVGTLLVAVGSAWAPWLALAGGACWLVPLGRAGIAWQRHFRQEILHAQAATPLLAVAMFGFGTSLVAGVWHAMAWQDSVAGAHLFVFAFLFPLLSGALGHLLPLWLRPGRQTGWHAWAHARLAWQSGGRALLFLLGGLVLLLNGPWGIYPALAGLLAFLPLLLAVLLSAFKACCRDG